MEFEKGKTQGDTTTCVLQKTPQATNVFGFTTLAVVRFDAFKEAQKCCEDYDGPIRLQECFVLRHTDGVVHASNS